MSNRKRNSRREVRYQQAAEHLAAAGMVVRDGTVQFLRNGRNCTRPHYRIAWFTADSLANKPFSIYRDLRIFMRDSDRYRPDLADRLSRE